VTGVKFVSGSREVLGPTIAWSASGHSWAAIEGVEVNSTGIAWGNGQFVASLEGYQRVMRSADGLAWTVGAASELEQRLTGFAGGRRSRTVAAP
jgi:hypothetical protein